MNLVLYSVLYALKYITNNLTIILTVYEAFINSLEYSIELYLAQFKRNP